MSHIADQLLALAKHTGAPDVVEDAAHMLKSLEGVRAERDILQEIVDEQRAQIAQLVRRIEELTAEVASVTDERRHAVAALSEQVDTVRTERDEARRALCIAMADDITSATEFAAQRGWDCFAEVRP